MKNFFDRFAGEIVILDGGFGTMLQAKGLKPGELPESANWLHAHWVQDIHAQYLQAGSRILSTNTFGANRLKIKDCGKSVEEVYALAVENAKKAFEDQGLSPIIAASIGPSGKLLEPLGDLAFEDAVSLFGECARAAEKAGADYILFETFSDLYEAKAAVLGAMENSALPVAITFSFDGSGKLLTGAGPTAAGAAMEALGVQAVGLNCGLGPEQMLPMAKEMRACVSIPMMINPNAGLPRIENGKTVYDLAPDLFAEHVKKLAGIGANFLGGCCGTNPDHIRALKHALDGAGPVKYKTERKSIITSGVSYVEIGKKPVIIGERINPTGKPKLKRALKAGDMDYILQEAVAQADAGSHILDVNVGLPGIDEAQMLTRAVRALQGVVTQPLQLDTANPVAMEKAVRIYNGRALLNSVNGKAESLKSILPIAKKYGAMVVALTLDENGIPETAAGRFEIAKKIAAEAEKYGLAKADLVFDPLVMTISTSADNARITLETLRLIHQAGYKTAMGVSNVSFGLPAREKINAQFFSLALAGGLDAAIVNPLNAAMMDAYFTHMALWGEDGALDDYIARFADRPVAEKAPSAQKSLKECVLSGLKDAAYLAAQEMLKEKEPKQVIDEELIPALNQAGIAFKSGSMFLPQLLMTAEAAKSAFAAIREQLAKSDRPGESQGKIILATVKGDVHDIGKNIVRALLENYGYDVIDLGRDVPKEAVLEAVKRENAPMVGLSALMTTTVGAMEETIALLREKADVKIVVGGAVLTHDYAMHIGADFYAQDAMDTVRYAQKFFGHDA